MKKPNRCLRQQIVHVQMHRYWVTFKISNQHEEKSAFDAHGIKIQTTRSACDNDKHVESHKRQDYSFTKATQHSRWGKVFTSLRSSLPSSFVSMITSIYLPNLVLYPEK
ncbi:hypothetical protein ABVK25_001858 [Lepraria finkii]|uniref:Uncharacterized protein n=1 Tax=Lepraria finkii TaxID=1340010 RepID=A0ABR4BKH6_9LECA